MKPIMQAFKAAKAIVCLANEWRDSIFYTGAALCGAEVAEKITASSHPLLGVPIGVITFGALAVHREVIRSTAWAMAGTFSKQIVGSRPSSRINPDLYSGAAMSAVMMSCSTTFGIMAALAASTSIFLPHFLGFTVSGMALSAIMSPVMVKMKGGNFGDIPTYYGVFSKDTGMWDWPRKRNGDGGTTQTQKMIDGWDKANERVFGGMMPEPTRVPVRVPVSRYAPNLNA